MRFALCYSIKSQPTDNLDEHPRSALFIVYLQNMLRLRLAAAAVNQTPMAWEANRDRLLAVIADARAADASILCLPELCISGYGCEDQYHSVGLQQICLEMLAELVPATRGMAVCFGLPLAVRGGLYNGAALACDGELLGVALKQHLAGDGIHYEPRWFRKWIAGDYEYLDVAGHSVPVGDVLFDCGGVKIGIEICRDAWVADRPGSRFASAGADVILNPTASHFAFGKQEVRKRFVLEGSRMFHVSFAYANLLGNEAGRAIFDGGSLIASAGALLAEGPRLSFAERLLTFADVDVEATRRLRAARSEPSRPADPFDGEVAMSDFKLPSPTSPCPPAIMPPWDVTPPSKEEEFARAVPLALFDYLRKSAAGGLVVSLSGGADSSATSLFVWLMVKLAVAEIGRDEFMARLPRLKDLAQASTDEAMVGRLLTCVYQSTQHSSDETRRAAETIANSIGARFLHWGVDQFVDGYVQTVAQAIGREISWGRDDGALQNIQARVRGPGVWLLANLQNALLLATSNRSEIAVGYATMDGDTCGGLAPIAGIDKAYLRQWLRWMENVGPCGVGPFPALSVINQLEPTAELRPQSENQTDESDLMPYIVLDAIERAAIRDKLTPVEVFEVVSPEFPQFTSRQLGTWVDRFFTLWCRHQWKRERYAPAFHLDDENLDPKTWCRFPILSGGFERELAILQQHIDDLPSSNS